MVRLAIKHYDRPTDLKNAILDLQLSVNEIIESAKIAVEVYDNFTPIQNDIRLACLRSCCTHDFNNYEALLLTFPLLNTDSRAEKSIEFYKQKQVDNILGIENNEVEPEDFDDNNNGNNEVMIRYDEVESIQSEIQTNDVSEFNNIIRYSDDNNRTLNQLRDEITKILNLGLIKYSQLAQIQYYLLLKKKSKRSCSDFFVAALRSIGKISEKDAIDFGERFYLYINDHRALRTLVIYYKRNSENEKAISLMKLPYFKHDDITSDWLEKAIDKRRDLILGGKLKPKFDKVRNNETKLIEYINDIFETLHHNLDVAKYIYKYLKFLYRENESQILANEIIKWGEAVTKLEHSNKSNMVVNNEEKFSRKSYNRLLRKLRRVEDSVSLKLGNHLTSSVKNPFKLLALPVTFPILAFRLGLERLGKTKSKSNIKISSEPRQRKNSIVLFPTNGVGFGHFTRMYAIARALRKEDPSLEIIFFTPMPTLHILYSDGFPTYHIAGRYKHSEMSARQWNGLVEEMLTLIFEMHSPKWFVFDGAFPYRGMLNAIQAQQGMKKYWMYRGTMKKNKSIPNGSVEMFDTIIRPQDVSKTKLSRFDLLTKEVYVNPITLINPSEMLSREQARSLLSLPKGVRVVYVQLGAGRINDITSIVRIVIDELLLNDNIHVVLGESMLGERNNLSIDRLHTIRDYPNAMYLKAFDCTVQAGGYNSFHEMRSVRIPTLFIPNTNTGMDDQTKRVMLSVDEGWGIIAKPNKKDIAIGIKKLSNLTKIKSDENQINGSTETAKFILSQP
ncbi:hypothetical protein N9U53_00620 [Euryarchaeota archaeon]|nr:hypothetical protein [Euryarchaeota archaeon]